MSVKLLLSIFILVATLLSTSFHEPVDALNIPAPHQQLILVLSDSWDAPTGKLQRFGKVNDEWLQTGKVVEVSLGKNGMGWGRGLHTTETVVQEKVEGDGKAPAGIFEFGTAFGYALKPPVGTKIPYRPATSRDYWVDAPNSPDYNQWVSITEDKLNDPKKMWNSFERMKRVDHLYELGLVVKHNMNPIEKGKGSAIFMHICRSVGAPTLGCTAMNKEDLTEIITWLDPAKAPILVQIPKGEFSKLRLKNR